MKSVRTNVLEICYEQLQQKLAETKYVSTPTLMIQGAAVAVSIALAIGSACAANGQSAVEQLQPLVEASGRRINIAEEVALAKWDSGRLLRIRHASHK